LCGHSVVPSILWIPKVHYLYTITLSQNIFLCALFSNTLTLSSLMSESKFYAHTEQANLQVCSIQEDTVHRLNGNKYDPNSMPPSFLLNQILIGYRCFQISDMCHIFKESVCFLSAIVASCILVLTMLTSRPTSGANHANF
jgi:hypothetical protein